MDVIFANITYPVDFGHFLGVSNQFCVKGKRLCNAISSSYSPGNANEHPPAGERPRVHARLHSHRGSPEVDPEVVLRRRRPRHGAGQHDQEDLQGGVGSVRAENGEALIDILTYCSFSFILKVKKYMCLKRVLQNFRY